MASGCTGWSPSSLMASTKWSASPGWTQVNTESHLKTTLASLSDHVHTSSNCTSLFLISEIYAFHLQFLIILCFIYLPVLLLI
jgi:hypothetical protein